MVAVQQASQWALLKLAIFLDAVAHLRKEGVMAGPTARNPSHALLHAVTHRKDCGCYKSEERDPKCAQTWPDICPWRAYQFYRFNTGDFSSPEWWAYQLGEREGYSDLPPDARQFDPADPHVVHSPGAHKQ
jgi:hypothetical protein